VSERFNDRLVVQLASPMPTPGLSLHSLWKPYVYKGLGFDIFDPYPDEQEAPVTVWCEMCGTRWDAQSPGVRFHDGRWECEDEVGCLDARAAQPGWPARDVAALEHAFGQMPPARPGK
jgi:hypothetical protein